MIDLSSNNQRNLSSIQIEYNPSNKTINLRNENKTNPGVASESTFQPSSKRGSKGIFS